MSTMSTQDHGLWQGRTRGTAQLSARFLVQAIAREYPLVQAIIREVNGEEGCVPSYMVCGQWIHEGHCWDDVIFLPKSLLNLWAPEAVARFQETDELNDVKVSPFYVIICADQTFVAQQPEKLRVETICYLSDDGLIGPRSACNGYGTWITNDQCAGCLFSVLPWNIWATFAAEVVKKIQTQAQAHELDRNEHYFALNTPFYITYKVEHL